MTEYSVFTEESGAIDEWLFEDGNIVTKDVPFVRLIGDDGIAFVIKSPVTGTLHHSAKKGTRVEAGECLAQITASLEDAWLSRIERFRICAGGALLVFGVLLTYLNLSERLKVIGVDIPILVSQIIAAGILLLGLATLPISPTSIPKLAYSYFKESKEASLVVSVVVLIGLIYPVAKITAVANSLSVVTSTLADISREHSTVYIGEFPNNIEELVYVIENAEHELLIACDFPLYGDFSNPDSASRYRDALKRKIEDQSVEVKMICYDEGQCETATESQFGQFQTLEEIKDRSPEKYDRWVERNFGLKSLGPRTKDEFLRELVKKNIEFLQNDKSSNRRSIAQELPLFLWIRDGEEAVFSFYNLSSEGVSLDVESSTGEVSSQSGVPQNYGEHSFRTTNEAIVRVLRNIHKTKWENSTYSIPKLSDITK